MNIRSKITLPMILLPLVSSLIILLVCVMLFTEEAEKTQNEMLVSAANTLESDLSSRKENAEQAARAISFDSIIIDVFDNREALSRRAAELQDETNVDFVAVTDKEGIIIVNTVEPEQQGISLSEDQSVKQALSGEAVTYVNNGKTIRLSIQSVYPVYDIDNKLIGSVIAGFRLDTVEYADETKEMTGSEITISLGDERVATTIKDNDGNRAVGTKVDEKVWSVVSEGQTYKGEVEILGENTIVEYRPLMKEDEVIGTYFVGIYTKATDDSILRFVVIVSAVVIVIMAIAVFLGYTISGRIARPIRRLVGIADRLAAGDVELHIESNGKDETAELTRAFSKMVEAFREQAHVLTAISSGDYTTDIEPKSPEDVVGISIKLMLEKSNNLLNEIRKTSEQVSRGSTQIAGSAQQLSTGSAEQAATIQQFVETVLDLKEQADSNEHLADKTLTEIKEADRLMDESMKYMNQMSEAMKEIDAGSKSISDIIKLIDNIAFQTNILSLNAAVEAARAGVHGKGFAVVADEVRNLAVKSAEAAQKTAELITDSYDRVEQGSHIALLTRESLLKVADIAEINGDSMKEIRSGSSLQSDMIRELNKGIEQISQVVEANSAAAEENAAAAEEMNAQSIGLDEALSWFRIKTDE